jgi:hypothetical protein
MRIALVGFLLITAALILASFAAAEPPLANELGRVMILEYHKIDYPEERWTRTPENFRRDLETLYARGYRLQSLNGLVEGRITVPAGTTPVVLTFDDSSAGQFRYVEHNGTLEIDPKSGVGVLEAFIREKPDFGRAATFFVLPGAKAPNNLFNQPEHEGRKLRWLVEQGYELGNHTLWASTTRRRCARSSPRPRSGCSATCPSTASAAWRCPTASIPKKSAGPSPAPPRAPPTATRLF